MKTRMLAVSVTLVVGSLGLGAQAQGTAPAQTPRPPATQQSAQPAGKAHMVEVEFVKVDPKTHTLAYKDASGKTVTAPLQETAEKAASTMKAGDRVRLTCMDNAKGEHQVVTAVERAPAPAKPRA